MSTKRLRAVTDTEKAAPAKPMSLVEAIESGDYLEILKAQRRDIAESLPNEKGPAKAALHRQLAAVSKEIEGLEAAAEDSPESVVAQTEDEAWDGTGY